GRLAVERARLVVLLRAALDAGDVAEPDDRRGLGYRAVRAGRAAATVHHACGARRGRAVRGVGPRRGRRLRRTAPLRRLDDDVGELLGVGQPAERVDRQLELLPLGDGLLADLPGGHLDVLLGDGGDDVDRAQVECGQLVGVDPGPQAVVALAEVRNAGDAFQA